mgnify:CR=1 FL=1
MLNWETARRKTSLDTITETNLLIKFADDITLSIPIGPKLPDDSTVSEIPKNWALVKYESYEIKFD